MPEFMNVPPSDPRGVALDLVRTPASSNFRAIVTSDDLLGCYTHFWKGRTLPHDHDDCAACLSGMPYRWHAWIAAFTSGKHDHVLFEMTAQAAETFVTFRKANGTLRGALFDAHRPSRRPNGRVHIDIKPYDTIHIALPTAPDVIKCLAIIWNVAGPSFNVDGICKEAPNLTIKDRSQPILHASKPNGEAL